MSAPKLPFFVYGTLRPGEANHDRFLRGRIRSEEPGRLTGAVLYEGPGYPYAVEECADDRGGVVRGEVVTALPEAYGELLVALDRLEEYTPGDPRSLYERVAREVTLDGGGRTVRAWVYVAAPSVAARLRARGKPIGSGDWLVRG
ncbi:gamma-glutamylcyclotransferase [Streptomyces sp. NBC_01604]|uniref:gamma-glutamylcyclotransferase family protein n=1 Tax=Streptomyces sp. NBC_01604 TaxID=2975894 RepID=UPI00386C66B3